jgi:hypothetical protein
MSAPLTPVEQLALGRILYSGETAEQAIARIVGTTDAMARQALNEPPVTAEPDDAELERMWAFWSERSGLADEPVADSATDDGDDELDWSAW